MIVPPRIYLQDVCLRHRFIRGKDTSDVYERPERIRAINIGIAALHARLETLNHTGTSTTTSQQPNSSIPPAPLTIVRSAATIDMRVHKAAIAVHSGEDEDGGQWCLADELDEWCVRSLLQIQQNGSEIPEQFEQDLYLCPESLQAFEGALGTVCEAVDHVCRVTGVAKDGPSSSRIEPEVGTPSPRVFVAVRPPGHHCGEGTPAGFGFVNNVCVGAFHAFEQHRLRRVVIFDYDLHHGNGTQEIVREYRVPKIYYGSMHDIKSYPCEAGHQSFIDDASLQLHDVDGEWIHNVHLLQYKTETEFWTHYEQRYRSLFRKATEFIEDTGGAGDDVIVFISCGFDASEYETTEMSRHNRHVPTSFYHKFTMEACAFADKYAGGRLVSVLEGGYSDRALTSGVMSHLAGLAEAGGQKVNKTWWSSDELNKIEKVTKKRRGRPPKIDHLDWWLQRMQQVFEGINRDAAPATPPNASELYVPPPPPAEPTAPATPTPPPKMRRARRTKRPLPPPTSMVTRGAKRASPDEAHSASAPPAPKRRRVSTEEREEEEESTADEMSVDSDAPLAQAPPRAKAPPSAWAGQAQIPATTGLPTPHASMEDVARPAGAAMPKEQQPKLAPTPNLSRIRGLAAARLDATSAAIATMAAASVSGAAPARPAPAAPCAPAFPDVSATALKALASLPTAAVSQDAGAPPMLQELQQMYSRLLHVQSSIQQLSDVVRQTLPPPPGSDSSKA